MSLKGRHHRAQPGCPAACVPVPLLPLTCQVTHTCVLSSLGIPLCGGPRPVFIQDPGFLFWMAQSTHKVASQSWHGIFSGDKRTRYICQKSGFFKFRARRKKGAVVAENFRFHSLSRWLLSLVLSWSLSLLFSHPTPALLITPQPTSPISPLFLALE